jgi:hypothetical protein
LGINGDFTWFSGDSSFSLMPDTIQALADLEALSDENITCRKQVCIIL